MWRLKSLLFLLVLAAQVSLASATVTYAVGSCKPSLPSFTTIMDALTHTPAPNVVQVCPGTYAEQVKITIPVTVEGITANNSSGATISVPSGGLALNATDSFGSALAAQVWVDNVGGAVNLTNLTLDGTGNAVTGEFNWVVGVFYQNSPGTMNHITTQYQSGNTTGVGVWLDGGSNDPLVTLENSNLQVFDNTGCFAGTNASTSQLTAIIKGNSVSGTYSYVPTGIDFGPGVTASVSDNLITAGNTYPGIWVGIATGGSGTEGYVSKNTITGPAFGISTGADGVSVTSNRIYNAGNGLYVYTSVGSVTDNIVNAFSGPYGNGLGIDFVCLGGSNVHSNTITGATTGLYDLPAGSASINIYYNVGYINDNTCSAAAANSRKFVRRPLQISPTPKIGTGR